jgi:hypothetical protein
MVASDHDSTEERWIEVRPLKLNRQRMPRYTRGARRDAL